MPLAAGGNLQTEPKKGQEGASREGATAIRPALSVIVPAFNERETIEEALRRVAALDVDLEIVVVDDASTDGTAELAAAIPGVMLLRHGFNQGKGMAIRTALAEARGRIVA